MIFLESIQPGIVGKLKYSLRPYSLWHNFLKEHGTYTWMLTKMMFISSLSILHCLYRLLSDTHQTSPWSQHWAKTLKNQTYIKWVNVTNFLSTVLDVSTLWNIKEWSVCMDCPDHVTATDGVSVGCWWWTFCRSLYTQIFHLLHVDGCAVSVPPVAHRSLDTTDI